MLGLVGEVVTKEEKEHLRSKGLINESQCDKGEELTVFKVTIRSCLKFVLWNCLRENSIYNKSCLLLA